MKGYRVHYRMGDWKQQRRIEKVYPTISAACKGRDRLMKRDDRVTSAWLVHVLPNGMEFCALSNHYARTR